jgi:hypothetical protein
MHSLLREAIGLPLAITQAFALALLAACSGDPAGSDTPAEEGAGAAPC